MPPLNPNEVRALIPEIPEGINISELTAEISYSLLQRVIELVNELDFKRITIMFDKLDEDIRFSSNAELITSFYAPIMGNNKLLLQKNIQFVFTVWKIAYDFMEDKVRTQKHYCPSIEWTEKSIKELLDKRLRFFTEIADFKADSLFKPEEFEQLIKKILFYANYNPRDLWHLFDSIIREQYKHNYQSKFIEISGVEKGIEKFVKEFNYFEYYPKKYSSSNALDIQDYIRTLVKTDKVTFTFNELKDGSGKSGGQARNYVGEMQKMGLIKTMGRTDNGGYIYKVQDPKIQYIIENKIEYD